MISLSIDIETYSSQDLKKVRVYKYPESEDFEILFLGYAFNDENVEIVDIALGESIPKNIIEALNDDTIMKTAFNANFEIVCLSKFLKIDLDLKQWQCSAVKSTMLGFPNSLEEVAKILKLEEQKDTRGKQLIRYFSMPCKPTKSNNERIRNLPNHDLKKWEEFKRYCKKDVVVEREIRKKLIFFDIVDTEQKIWEIDQKINNRGVKLDLDLAKNAINMFKKHKKILLQRAKEITKLENPNSIEQLKKWILDKTGKEIESLTKNNIDEVFYSVSNEKTLELKVDEKGLWGRIKINKKDTEAVNLYERVKRGDVDQCSFGFNVIKEDIEHKENGVVKWILKEVDLHEISVCTFPVYKETEVSARQLSNEEIKKRQLFIKKYKLKEKLKKS